MSESANSASSLAERLSDALLRDPQGGFTPDDVARGLPLLLMAATGSVPASRWPASVREWLTSSLQTLGLEPPFDSDESLQKLDVLMNDLNPNLTKTFGRVLREHMLDTQVGP